jgi:hypothetical protein
MSVKVRRYKRGGWEVDIRVVLPNGMTVGRGKGHPCPVGRQPCGGGRSANASW